MIIVRNKGPIYGVRHSTDQPVSDSCLNEMAWHARDVQGVVLDYVPSDRWRERREVRRTEREQTVDECEESRGRHSKRNQSE